MFFFNDSDDLNKDAIIVKLISEWCEKTASHPGRTLIQKLCYFAEAVGVPLGYKFVVYQYGPYSQDLYDHIDDMIVYGFLCDEHSENDKKSKTSSYSTTALAKELLTSRKDLVSMYDEKLHSLVESLKSMQLHELELFSTIHYYYTANRGYYHAMNDDGLKRLTIDKVAKAKRDRFEQSEIDEAYNAFLAGSLISC